MSEAGAGVTQVPAAKLRGRRPRPEPGGGRLASPPEERFANGHSGSGLTAACLPGSSVPGAGRGPSRHSFMVCDP